MLLVGKKIVGLTTCDGRAAAKGGTIDSGCVGTVLSARTDVHGGRNRTTL